MRFYIIISFPLRYGAAFIRSRNQQAIIELALRQQLATYSQMSSKPRLTPLDRAFWVLLLRFWSRWRDNLVIVKPDTVIRWHRKGFRLPGSGQIAVDFGAACHPATWPGILKPS